MRFAFRLSAALVASLATAGTVGAEESPEALVALLAPSQAANVTPEHRAAEDRLVALGDKALPALEKALRLGLRGQEAQAFTDSGSARRGAVVRVLASLPSARATDLLVRALADHPDNFAMRHANLAAVDARVLTEAHIRALLLGTEPEVVLLGLRKAGKIGSESPLAGPARNLHAEDRAREQLKNENGCRNANDDQLWDVHVAAGTALGIDMVPALRKRAWTLLGELEDAVLRPLAGPTGFSGRPHAEGGIQRAMGLLLDLGEPARDVVAGVAKSSSGDFRAVLDMTLLGFGQADKWEPVAAALTDSQAAGVRICAARALERAKDRRAIPALWKALADPFDRVRDGCCVMPDQGLEFPVRETAARALIALGEDVAVVRERARGLPPK